jgi:hypothetical protein
MQGNPCEPAALDTGDQVADGIAVVQQPAERIALKALHVAGREVTGLCP